MSSHTVGAEPEMHTVGLAARVGVEQSPALHQGPMDDVAATLMVQHAIQMDLTEDAAQVTGMLIVAEVHCGIRPLLC